MSGIKQKQLDQNLPPQSELRTYLENKIETTTIEFDPLQPNYVQNPFAIRNQDIKVLLVMPPMFLHEGAVKRVIPPLGLCYIAAYLESKSIHVDILDCVVEGIDNEVFFEETGFWRFGLSEEEFERRIAHSNYDIIGFSMIYSTDLRNLYDYAKITRRLKPDAIILSGGLHASIYTRRFLTDAVDTLGNPFIDFVIRGEGEIRLYEFINNLNDGFINTKQEGLAGWFNGKIFENPQRTQIQNLDDLPFPAYHKLPMEKYFQHNVPFSPYPKGGRVMQIYTSRGCPVGCTFCSSTNFNKAFRARSVENVIDEIRFYIENYAIDEIQFADDNLTFNRARSLELFNAMKGVKLPWCTPNGTMINTLDKEVLEGMINSGLYQITLSLDSGNEETLKKKHRKPVKLQRLPDLIEYLNERDIYIHCTLVVGMPGESVNDILKGFEFVKNLDFTSINVFTAQAIPGSELYENAIAEGTIKYEDALIIDTSRSSTTLTHIDYDELDGIIRDFLSTYNRMIFNRNPVKWREKYKGHEVRMQRILIGQASQNTAAIIAAANHELKNV